MGTRFTTVAVALVVGLVALGWLYPLTSHEIPSAASRPENAGPTPRGAELAASSSAAHDLSRPDAAVKPPPLAVPAISSRFSRVTSEVLVDYVERYAAKGPKSPGPQFSPVMRRLRTLYIATASYRSTLAFRESTHVTTLYEEELILIAMQLGATITEDMLRDRACRLKTVPKDCDDASFQTCATYVRLMDVSAVFCDDPRVDLPTYRNTDNDLGI